MHRLICLCLPFSLALAASCAADGRPPPTANIRDGPVVGAWSTAAPGVAVFLGVPFARVEQRFAPPAPPAPWDAPLRAARAGPACPQRANDSPGGRELRSERDCLALNVFAPLGGAVGRAPAPVMLWIHGGGLESGSSWGALNEAVVIAWAKTKNDVFAPNDRRARRRWFLRRLAPRGAWRGGGGAQLPVGIDPRMTRANSVG